MSPALIGRFLAAQPQGKSKAVICLKTVWSLSILSFICLVLLLFVCLFVFWPHHAACGILVPPPRPPALEEQSLNRWTTGEVLNVLSR